MGVNFVTLKDGVMRGGGSYLHPAYNVKLASGKRVSELLKTLGLVEVRR